MMKMNMSLKKNLEAPSRKSKEDEEGKARKREALNRAKEMESREEIREYIYQDGIYYDTRGQNEDSSNFR